MSPVNPGRFTWGPGGGTGSPLRTLLTGARERRLKKLVGAAAAVTLLAGTSAWDDSRTWLVHTDVSPVDDSKSVYLSLPSRETVRGRYGNPVRPTLHIRCKENTTAFFVDFGGHYMSDHDYGTPIALTPDLHGRRGSWNRTTMKPLVCGPGVRAFRLSSSCSDMKGCSFGPTHTAKTLSKWCFRSRGLRTSSSRFGKPATGNP